MPDCHGVGDHCEIHRSVRIDCDEFSCGDYDKIHSGTWIRSKRVTLGHCAWAGQDCILDGSGGLDIGFAVGIGSGSHVWTHAAHGDRLQGCVLGSEGPRPLELEDDAWLLPRVLVAGARRIGKRAVVMAGSVVTKDVPDGEVWAGRVAAPDGLVPFHGAQRLTAWEPRHAGEIRVAWEDLLAEYDLERGELPVNLDSYDPVSREYTKTNEAAEIAFNKWLFHGRAYFKPRDE